MLSRGRRDALVVALGALSAAVPARALAQQGALDGVGGGVGTFGAWDWVGLALRLGVVLIVIWVAVMAMRWYVRRMSGVGNHAAGRQLQVIETRTLAPNRSLHLVRLGGRAVLVGVTPERISPLLQIDDADEVRRLVESAEQDEPSRSLRTIVGGLGGMFSLRRRSAPRGPDTASPAFDRPPFGGVSAPAQQLAAMSAERRAQLAEIQRAITRARQGVQR